jgi:hypothetical protein
LPQQQNAERQRDKQNEAFGVHVVMATVWRMLRDRIVAAFTPRVAAAYPFEC